MAYRVWGVALACLVLNKSTEMISDIVCGPVGRQSQLAGNHPLRHLGHDPDQEAG
jgi:hypothetical protein